MNLASPIHARSQLPEPVLGRPIISFLIADSRHHAYFTYILYIYTRTYLSSMLNSAEALPANLDRIDHLFGFQGRAEQTSNWEVSNEQPVMFWGILTIISEQLVPPATRVCVCACVKTRNFSNMLLSCCPQKGLLVLTQPHRSLVSDTPEEQTNPHDRFGKAADGGKYCPANEPGSHKMGVFPQKPREFDR